MKHIILLTLLVVSINSQTFSMLGAEFASEPMENQTNSETIEKFLQFLAPFGDDDFPRRRGDDFPRRRGDDDDFLFPRRTPTRDTRDTRDSRDRAPETTFDKLVSSFTKLQDPMAQFVQTFKTSRSSTIKERLIGQGFEKFSSSAQVQVTKGVKEQYLDKYLKNMETKIKVPEERQEDLKMVLEESKWASSNVWNAYNTLFSVDKGGNTKFCSILVSRNDANDTYDFVYSDIQATFMLAPDIMVINKKLSVLGGLWSDEKDIEQKVPKNLTHEDIETVISFFNIVAFKNLAKQFNIYIEFPQL